MTIKQRAAYWLKHFKLLRWGLWLGVRLFAPQNHVGAVGAVFNKQGQVLMVEHVFRPDYAWGLPGGWVERGEDPACAVKREFKEELNLNVIVKRLLLCKPQGGGQTGVIPPGLGLAYYCRLADDSCSLEEVKNAKNAFEVLSVRWVDPDNIKWRLPFIQAEAIALGKQEFDKEQKSSSIIR